MEDCMINPPEDLWGDNWLDDYDPYDDLTDDEISLFRTDPGVPFRGARRATGGSLMPLVCVVVDFVYPPIPIRSFDWCAFEEGREEQQQYGYGVTREAAVADLFEQLDEREEE